MTHPMTILQAAALLCLPALASAQSAEEVAKMRNAHMELQAYNFGILGRMAQGKEEFDATLASQAADNLRALAESDWAVYFRPGSSMEEVPGSEAAPGIWTDWEDFLSRKADLEAASVTMVEQAGQDLNTLRGGVRDMAKACSGCHTTYRISN